ncbi:MAG: hydroxyisourate hydrolase [Hyphomicrobiales bacterium]|nr:hydroxyisourate hydrolase [Alphaproteobacteria bacterium]
MPGISIHVVDVARGLLCEGMSVALYSLDASGAQTPIAQGRIGRSGLLESPGLMKPFPEGRYRAVFQIGQYYKDAQAELPLVTFLDVVTFDFGVDDPEQHYHLPMKCTPWGYSCFRGGA